MLTPDGTIHTRPDGRWEDRRWATISRDHERIWRIVRTSGEKPRTAIHAVPVQHTITVADRDSRTRARHARARLGQLRRWKNDVDEAVALGPDSWDTHDFGDTVRTMAADRARWVLVRLLAHVQDGRCAGCGIVPERLVRGVLCPGCNGGEGGGFGADQRESQLTTYRANPPAARFAWTYPGAEPNP